jgi:hypothetical protein
VGQKAADEEAKPVDIQSETFRADFVKRFQPAVSADCAAVEQQRQHLEACARLQEQWTRCLSVILELLTLLLKNVSDPEFNGKFTSNAYDETLSRVFEYFVTALFATAYTDNHDFEVAHMQCKKGT